MVTLNMMMFCLASQPFPAEPLSCCIVEDAAVQDPGPVVAAVLHFPPHLAVHSPQHTVAVLGQQPLNPAEEAGPCHHPPAQAVEVLHHHPPQQAKEVLHHYPPHQAQEALRRYPTHQAVATVPHSPPHLSVHSPQNPAVIAGINQSLHPAGEALPWHPLTAI